jgi:hypothetical protein
VPARRESDLRHGITASRLILTRVLTKSTPELGIDDAELPAEDATSIGA